MGKAAATTTRMAKTATTTAPPPEAPGKLSKMKRKKKKGRPSLLDLQKRQQQQQQETLTPPPAPSPPNYNFTPTRRSTRRNLANCNSPSSKFINDDYDDDDDDERQQKKVKLVVRLPQSTQHHFQNSPSQNSSSASISDADEPEDHEAAPKTRKINAVDGRSNDVVLDQGERAPKATDTVHGSPLESGPTTPLPDKKMLVFVLDRLQKKDTYGVFSEPVDPDELPDYHEIVEHPMDFGTVRKKLDGGVYSNLEELEADVLLICSNATQYNAPDTIYFRQARSIQELAKRDFENLRNEGDNGEPQPKVVRRGRPPSKNLKKPPESSPVDRVGFELSSGATLASAEDKAIGSSGYNLRKGPMFYRFHSNDAIGTSFRPRNGENYSDWLVDWNSEFPASILKADMKYGKKHFSVDENRRDTYKQFHHSRSSSDQSYLWSALGDMKWLMAVGLHLEPHAYAQSLARYAANLGPVTWNVASSKLKSALPDGLAFGLGWVEENDTPLQPLSFSAEKLTPINGLVNDRDSSRRVTPSTSGLSFVVRRPSAEMVEAVRRLNCQNELSEQAGGAPWTTPGTSFQAKHKSVFEPNGNGFNARFGFDLSTQTGIARQAIQAGQSGLEDGLISNEMLGMLSTGDVSSLRRGPSFQASSEEIKLSESLGTSGGNLLGQASDSDIVSEVGIASRSSAQVLSAQHRQPIAVPPDLNVRVQASGSPSSSLQFGSPQQPQQPDLALQL